MMKKSIGIVGVTGYSGEELLKILLRHKGISVNYLAARRLKKAVPVGRRLPAFKRVKKLIHPFKVQEAIKSCDLVFLALPHGLAMTVAPALLKKPGLQVIDVSGDFRLKSAGIFAQAYKMKHAAPQLLKESVYGLTEFSRDALRKARLVANPGCYPTAVLLGLAPLAQAKWIARQGVSVDAKSGITGAGRSQEKQLKTAKNQEALYAYRVGKHQHTPEMEQTLKQLSKQGIKLTFIPHLAPMDRGIYATMVVPLKRKVTSRQVRGLYQKTYAKEPFVRLLPEGSWPDVTQVNRTNRCDIALQVDSKARQVIVISAIDNLVKGAAGQAVQNMNVLLGFKETMGLTR